MPLETSVPTPCYLDNIPVEEPGRSIVSVCLENNGLEGVIKVAWIASGNSKTDTNGSITVDRLGSLFGL